MRSQRRAAVRRLRAQLHRLGLRGVHVRRVDRDTLLASRRHEPILQPVGEGSWLVQSAGARPLQVQPVGDGSIGATLLWNRKAVRSRPMAFQRELSGVLAGEQLAWTLSSLRVNCVLDVGANVGQYARLLRSLGYRGRIVSLEPVARPLRRLREAAAHDPRWRVLPCAAGAETTRAVIHAAPGTLSSLLPASDFGRGWSSRLEQTTPETVSVRRLDEVWEEATSGIARPRVFVKLDTQGYDLAAFAGLGDRASDVVGLQSELACVPLYQGMPLLPEQLSVYQAAGLELAGMFPVSREPRTQRVIEYDAVLVRAGAFRRRRDASRTPAAAG